MDCVARECVRVVELPCAVSSMLPCAGQQCDAPPCSNLCSAKALGNKSKSSKFFCCHVAWHALASKH